MRPSFAQQSHGFVSQLCLLFLLLNLGILLSDAAPTGIKSHRTTLLRRQDSDTSQPTTVTTVSQINTANGPVTETCQITLTPVNVNGEPQVEEVKSCTVSSDSGSGSSSAAGSDTSTVASAGSTSSSVTSSSAATSTSTSDGGSSATSATTSASVSSATGPGSGPLVNGLSSVAAPTASATASGSASTATSSSASKSSSASGSASSAVSTGTSAPDSVSTSSASAAAASAAGTAAAAVASQAAFTLPGKKLSVLPIGLGVFAGISVIALIVVGLVTYERTKYRKAFRQRKLAEQGGAMGYGGMAERT